MENEIQFNLHTNQLEIFESASRYRVLVAGRRFGKTTLAVIELIVRALQKPESLLWYVSPSYRQSKMIAWRLLKKTIPESVRAKINEAELSINLINGSVIELKGADNEDSLRGAGLNGMVIDEFASIYNNWSVWHEVLRPMLVDKKGWVLFIGTPKGKDAFFDLYMKGARGEDGYKSWQFKTIDNPFIEANEVEEAKRNSPERYFRQEFEASFEDFVGLIYPEFNKSHVIEPVYIPVFWERLGCIDTAVSGTTGVLKAAIDENANLLIYDEYYEENKRASEVASQIKEEGVKWLIDPNAKETQYRAGESYTLWQEYKDAGISSENAQKDVHAGINRTGEYFKTNRIKIFKTCVNLINELERYHWQEPKETIKGEVVAEPFKKDDHLCDCLRYLIMSRPSAPEMNIEETINPNSAYGRFLARRRKAEDFTYARNSS